MRRARTRTALALASLMASALGLAEACGSFSGADTTSDAGGAQDASTPVDGTVASTTDAGTSKEATAPDSDASFDAAPPPTACDTDAANVAFCDSFEQLMPVACGSEWTPMKGTGTIITGGAHGGSSFCRFCPTSAKGELDHTSAVTSTAAYVMTAWVRSGPRADASAAPSATTQIFAYPSDGGYIGRTDQLIDPLSTTSWTKVQNSVPDAALATHELINFYAEPFFANAGQCIDVDDVVLFRQD